MGLFVVGRGGYTCTDRVLKVTPWKFSISCYCHILIININLAGILNALDRHLFPFVFEVRFITSPYNK